MNFTVKTATLQEMVSRSIKGVGNNKLIPITSLMGISLEDNRLMLTTTDATNYLYIREDKIDGDDFHITVEADTFSKLISRMTSETVTLELQETALQVKGNGSYRLELPVDEEGSLITFPDPYKSTLIKVGEDVQLHLSTVQTILSTLKPALAVTLENPCYTGYYVGSKVVATDTYKIACMDVNILDKDMLISPEMMNLLSVMTSEKIQVDVVDNIIVCSSPDCVVYGPTMEGIEDYRIDAISSLVDTKFSSMCKVPKAALLQVLDRLGLFVSTYDKNGIYLTFSQQGVQISSKASTGVEIIPYTESHDFKDFTCCVDIEMLISQVKSQATDVIELYYGLDNAIKMVDGNITIIVALLEDDR